MAIYTLIASLRDVLAIIGLATVLWWTVKLTAKAIRFSQRRVR